MAGDKKGNVIQFRDTHRNGGQSMRRPGRQRVSWKLFYLVAITIFFAGMFAFQLANSPWSAGLTLRHWMAAPNCAAARAVGLAPAVVGHPGYYRDHDADGDGIACEPLPLDR
ncbi:MAG: hypothetical protein GC185_06320 [Alphaproteobacteria bacterium]|nr:hypothetical protein [Alphaproteobacteria bacterium]